MRAADGLGFCIKPCGVSGRYPRRCTVLYPLSTRTARLVRRAFRHIRQPIYMVGRLNDPGGWDHLDNEAKNVRPVAGTAEIDVNEIQNTGKFEARLKIPEGDLVLAVDSGTSSIRVRTAASSRTSMNTVRTRVAETTTGRRPSGSWLAGVLATRPSTESRYTRTTKCTSW